MTRHLLLLPGLLCDRRVFSKIMGPVAAMGGWTLHVPRTDEHGDISALAEALLTAAPASRVAVAGFSFGGYVALEMCRLAPDRVSHLALMSTQARPDTAQTRQRRLAQVARAQAEGSTAGVIAEQLPLMVHALDAGGAAAAVAAAFSAASREVAAPNTPAEIAAAMALDMGVPAFSRQQQAIMSRRDGREALRAVAARGVPVAVIAGDQDGLIPLAAQVEMFQVARHASEAAVIRSAGATAFSHLANARATVHLARLPACGHLSVLEQPRLAVSALSWLLGHG